MLAVIGHGVELAPLWSPFVYFAYALLEENTFPIEFTHDLDAVMVNGKIVVDPEGYHPDPRPGMVIRKQGQ